MSNIAGEWWAEAEKTALSNGRYANTERNRGNERIAPSLTGLNYAPESEARCSFPLALIIRSDKECVFQFLKDRTVRPNRAWRHGRPPHVPTLPKDDDGSPESYVDAGCGDRERQPVRGCTALRGAARH